jgi:hypothetical protein
MPIPSPTAAERADLDGRTFAGVSNSASGEVGSTTIFSCHQAGDVVWAGYAGGDVVRGYLVGTRDGATLSFRYSHLNAGRQTANGVCGSRIEVLGDGRLLLHESWAWEPRAGTGTSIVEERR